MCSAVSESVAGVRAQIATLAPSRASSSATERPSPLLATATMATRPVRPRSNPAPVQNFNPLATHGRASNDEDLDQDRRYAPLEFRIPIEQIPGSLYWYRRR